MATVTGDSKTNTYTAANQSNSYTTSGLQGLDTVTGVSGLGSGTNAGTYADNLSNAAGTGLSNYNISYVNGGLTIAPAALTITAANDNKTYDGHGYSGGKGVSYSGFVNGETSAVLGGALTYGGSSQSTVNAGSYAISPGGLTSGNYDITFNNGTLTINPKALTIKGATTQNRIYDGTRTVEITGETLSGVISGDNVSVSGGGTMADKNAGKSKAVNAYLTLSGGDAANYTLTQPTGLTVDIYPSDQYQGAIHTADKDASNNTVNRSVPGNDNSSHTLSLTIQPTASVTTPLAMTPVGMSLTTVGGGARNISLDMSGSDLTIKFTGGNNGSSPVLAANSDVALVSVGNARVQAKDYYKVASSSDSLTLKASNAVAAPLPADPLQSSSSTTFSLNAADGKVAQFQIQYADGAISIKPLNDSAAALTSESVRNKKLVAASAMLAAQQDLTVDTQSIAAIYLH